MEQHQNYTREVLEHQEEALSKVVSKVPRGSLVLDIGCGSGMMGRYLAEHRECVVDGVDIDPQAIELARAKYRRVGVFNLERDSLLPTFSPESYDCIVMADVIEHIVNPESLFSDVKRLLKPDGILLFSIPNISHLAAGLELVLGKFDYQNSGLLDATHVRFYSRESFVAKLAVNGIYVQEIDTVKKDIDQTEFSGYKHFPKQWVKEITEFREDALTYQWIMSARLFKSVAASRKDAPIPGISPSYLSLNSRLYWRSAFEDSYMEENSIPGRVAIDEQGWHSVVFDFTDANCSYPVVDFRVDPVSDKTNFVFKNASLVSNDHQTLWATRQLHQEEFFNANIFSDTESLGFAVVPTTDDPQWNLKVNSEALALIGPGCSFQLGLSISPDLICATVVAALHRIRDQSIPNAEFQALKALSDQRLLALDTMESSHAASLAVTDEVSKKLKVSEAQVSDARILIDQQSAQISALEAQISMSEVRITESLAQQVALRSEIQNARIEQNLMAETIEHKLAEIGALEAAFTACDQQLKHAVQNHSQTLETISWRVTKPLRWIRRKFS